MYKAKQRLRTLLLACFAALVSMFLAVALWIAPAASTYHASAATASDTLTRATTGITNTSYTEWSGKTGTSGAVYAGQSAGGNSSIQLRSKNNNSGIVTTASGGKVVKITVVWNSNTSSGRTLDVYGKNTAYSKATDLYSSSTQGTKLGSIKYGTSTELTINGDYTFIGMRSSSDAMYLTSITIDWDQGASCEHANTTTETTDATCTVAGSTVVTCDDCGEEVSNTVIPATGHKTTETIVGAECTTAGSKTIACENCDYVETTEIPATGHDFAAPTYERNGNQHTATGTCNVCGETTSETEDCTLSLDGYAALDTDSQSSQQHAVTTTCSVCEQSGTAEEDCSFDEGVLNGTMLTYTCEHCEYSYSEEVATTTATYIVPNGIKAIEPVTNVEGFTTELPSAETIDGYTFVGWVTTTLDEATEVEPTSYKAGATYTVSVDTTFYALYSYTEGTGAWTLVTDVDSLAVGKEIVIAASGSNHALGADKGNNRNAATITKNGSTLEINNDVQIITLETGKKDNTFAFNVGDGYLYAASSGSNYLKTKSDLDDNGSWLITIDSKGIATIKAQGTYTRNWLRKNSSSALFACYSSGQNDVSIYMKDGATYYVTSFNACAHENTSEEIELATCTKPGSRIVTCDDCSSQVEAEILPALGHNYVNGICENCEKVNPASIVYDGYYYLILNNKYAGEKDGNFYKLFDYTPSESIDLNYVFYFVNNGETYDMYNVKAGLISEGVTIETQDDYSVHIKNSEGKILSHNTSYSTYQRMGFYATSNSYPAAITLDPVQLANIDGASITIGETITMNYKVSFSLSETFAKDAKMHFEFNGKTYEVAGEKDGERYVFKLEIPPHLLATEIDAVLKYGDIEIASKLDYSVKTYAQNLLNDAESSDKLKQLITDLLYYGNAAYNYINETTDEPATNGVENLGTASNATPDTTIFSLVRNDAVDSYPAYFTGATVYFDSVNKLRVKINTTENVTVTINGVEVEVNSTTIETDGIIATDFDTTYTFVLYHNGVEMQTLKYSVNAYAYSMKNKETAMGTLALALYRYGVSAKAYKATQA